MFQFSAINNLRSSSSGSSPELEFLEGPRETGCWEFLFFTPSCLLEFLLLWPLHLQRSEVSENWGLDWKSCNESFLRWKVPYSAKGRTFATYTPGRAVLEDYFSKISLWWDLRGRRTEHSSLGLLIKVYWCCFLDKTEMSHDLKLEQKLVFIYLFI